jgi:hypothetical protein
MEEITLLVDEQRRLCHVISQGQFSKFCYAMWNKPIMRTTQIISTTLNTIFPENLGLAINEKALLSTSSSTYPFAFTLIYIFGLVLVIKSSRQDKRLQFLLLVYLGAVLVSASTGVVTIHRNLLGLVLSGIIAYYGYSVLVKNSSTLPFKIGIASITLVLLFQETQALTHYFFVQPAVETINNEYHYRQIANFMALHHGDNISYYDNHVLYPGATMYSFFSGLSPVKYRQSITYTNVNENGNIWPISVEGYTPTDLSLDKLVCTVTTPEAYYISKYDPTLVAYQVVGTNVHGLPTPLYAIYDLVKLKAIAYPGKCN